MEFKYIFDWFIQSERRKEILVDFNQPLTATHIAQRTNISLDACLHVLWVLSLYNIVYCLNKDTRYNRVYWLTELGKRCQQKLREDKSLRPLARNFPSIPWNLFGSVCYSHRSTVIKTMHEPMQAAKVKRKALYQNSKLRMSANNVRDVMKYLLSKDIVRKVYVRRKRHPRYELTELGKEFKGLLISAKGDMKSCY